MFDKLFQNAKAKGFDSSTVELPEEWSRRFLKNIGIVNWSESRDRTFITKGFQINPAVYNSVDLLTTKVAQVDWKIFTYDKDGKKIEATDKLLEEVLRCPNSIDGTWNRLVAGAFGFYLINGNSFIWGLPNGGDGSISGTPTKIFTLPSQHVQIYRDPGFKGISHYNLDFYGADDPIPADQVWHQRKWNPDYNNDNDSFLYGQSPLEAMLRSLDTNNEAITTMKSLLERQGPPGVLSQVFQENNKWVSGFNKSQKEKLQTSFDKAYRGGKNAGHFPITPQEFKWTQIGSNPVELALMDKYKVTSKNIYNTYKIPAEIFEGESKYENQKEAKKAMWSDGIIPWINDFKAGINQRFISQFGDGNLFLDCDYSNIPELQEDFGKRTEALAKLSQVTFLSIDEARKEAGFEEYDGEGGAELQKRTNPTNTTGDDSSSKS